MRVLLDGFWWVHGPGANRTVMREFIFEWQRQFPQDELILALRAQDADDADVPPGLEVVHTRLWPQLTANGIELPRLARTTNADVIFAHNYAPLTGSSLVFVHDLLFLEHWDWFTTPERAYFTPMSWTQRRATVLATSTATEAARMERLVPSLAPVHPVGLAVATELIDAVPTPPENAPAGAFSLIVGRLNVRKNLEKAIVAAGRSQSITAEHPLLIVGDSAHSGRSLGLPATVEALVNEGRVRFLGRISDGELKWLYQRTALTIYLSLDEGFGLPPIEASAFGSPLLVSDIPVFRETVGDTAAFVDPGDVQAIAQAIDASFDPDRTDEAKAHASASKYRWSASVERLRSLALEAANS